MIIFYFLCGHSVYPENRIPIKPMLGGGAYAASKITLLHRMHMYGLNKTHSPMFVLFCLLCFQRQSFRFLIDTLGRFSADFDKGNKHYGTLFEFLHIKRLLKMSSL